MAINLTNNQGYKKEYFTVPKQSIYTIQFGNFPAPNYFRVNNMGSATLYCTTMSMPSKDQYDFKVEGKATTNFAEPYSRDRLYIYNSTSSDIKISVTSWYGEFDPSFLAVGEIAFTGDTTLTTDGKVKSFETSLPAGTNHLGTVTPTGEVMTDIKSATDLLKSMFTDNVNLHGWNIYQLLHNIYMNTSNEFEYSYLQGLCTDLMDIKSTNLDCANLLSTMCTIMQNGSGGSSAFSMLKPYYLTGDFATKNYVVSTDVGELTKANYIKLNSLHLKATDDSQSAYASGDSVTVTIKKDGVIIYNQIAQVDTTLNINLTLPAHMEGIEISLYNPLYDGDKVSLTYTFSFEQEGGTAFEIITGQEYAIFKTDDGEDFLDIKSLFTQACDENTTALTIKGITVNSLPEGVEKIEGVRLWLTASGTDIVSNADKSIDLGTLYLGANVYDLIFVNGADFNMGTGDNDQNWSWVMLGLDENNNTASAIDMTIHYEVIN